MSEDLESTQLNGLQDALQAKLDVCKSEGTRLLNFIEDLKQDVLTDDEKERLKDIEYQVRVSLDMCNEYIPEMIPSRDLSMRTCSGGGPRPYMDALLDIWSDLLDEVELLFEALKHLWDAIKHLAHCIMHEVSTSIQWSFAVNHAKETAAHAAEVAAQSATSGAAAATDPFPKPGMAGTIPAIAAAQAADAEAQAEKLAQAMREANEQTTQAAHHVWEECKSSFAAAKHLYFAMKKNQHANQIYAWMKRVMGVEPVPELPLPICGWDIEDPYAWVAGQIEEQIIPEDWTIIKELNIPEIIAEGPNAIELVNEYIASEIDDLPIMEMLPNDILGAVQTRIPPSAMKMAESLKDLIPENLEEVVIEELKDLIPAKIKENLPSDLSSITAQSLLDCLPESIKQYLPENIADLLPEGLNGMSADALSNMLGTAIQEMLPASMQNLLNTDLKDLAKTGLSDVLDKYVPNASDLLSKVQGNIPGTDISLSDVSNVLIGNNPLLDKAKEYGNLASDALDTIQGFANDPTQTISDALKTHVPTIPSVQGIVDGMNLSSLMGNKSIASVTTGITEGLNLPKLELSASSVGQFFNL